MRDLYDNIINNYGVRYKKKQKQRFLSYAKDYFEDLGYTTEIQKSIFGKNLMVGNIKSDNMLIAHYDTPTNMNMLLIGYKIYGLLIAQIISVFLILGLSILVSLNIYQLFNYSINVFFLFLLAIILLLIVPNKNNVNDNTSGIVSIMNIAKVLSEQNMQNDIFFVLADNEEKGLFGSFALKRYMKKRGFTKNKKCIAIESVDNGDENAILYNKKSGFQDEVYNSFVNKTSYNIIKKRTDILMSDHIPFSPNSLMVSGVYRTLIGNFIYIKDMHTNNDANYDIRFIEKINMMIYEYLVDNINLSNTKK